MGVIDDEGQVALAGGGIPSHVKSRELSELARIQAIIELRCEWEATHEYSVCRPLPYLLAVATPSAGS